MPLVRLVLPLMAGVMFYLLQSFRMPWYAFAMIYVTMALTWIICRHYALSHYSRRWMPGCLAICCIFIMGYHLGHQYDQRFHPEHFSRFEEAEGFLLLRIREPPGEKANSFQVIGEVTQFVGDSGTAATRGRLMLYLQKDSLAAILAYGDLIVVENRYERIRPPQNPHQFDYRRFLAYRNIHHSSYRRSGQWHPVGINQGHLVISASLAFREYALEVFARHMPMGREYAVISALLLGYREYLDEDLRREFAGAGAMHILCVSGLHVGIIYMVLNTLLAFLGRLRGGHIIRTVLILLLIWLYAAITGFSPSVLRASAMFSFVAAGNTAGRRTNIYNTLAASAMLLVVIDPFIITRIGFQLSYLAVLSIVSIQPWLYNKLKLRYWLTDKAWAIITVSVAAQLATGPLALYYFHQFPNYFLITNLIVIPLSGLIIYSGLFTLLVSSLAVVGNIGGGLLHALLMILHHAVKLIEGLPFSTTEHVYLSLFDTLLVFSLLIATGLYLMKGFRKAFLAGLVSVLLLAGSFSFRAIERNHNAHFVVYHANNATAVDFFSGDDKIRLLCGASLLHPERLDFQSREYRISRGAMQASQVLGLPLSGSSKLKDFHQKGDWIAFAGKTIMVLDNENAVQYDFTNNAIPDELPRMHPDYLFVCQNPRLVPEKFLAVVTPKKLILDASNPHWTANRWKEACDTLGIAYWSVRDKGAYVGF